MSEVPAPSERTITDALLEHEHRYASLFGTNPDVVYVLDAELRIASGNEALARVTGHALDELVGRPFLELVDVSDRERVRRHLARAAAGETQEYELTGAGADGRCYTLSVTTLPLRLHGRTEGVYGIARELTQQRDAERALLETQERYRLLAENVHDMISLHDLEGRFLYASPSAARMLGYDPAQLLGRSVYELVEPDDVASLREAHAAILRREGKQPARFRARRADGTLGWFEATARTALQDGEPWRIIAVTRDITERRAFERQLLQSQKMEALGRLAGGIAHDFSNMLTVIVGQAELLLGRLSDDARARLGAEHIREAAHRAAALTQRLLAFSRGDVSTAQPTSLNEVILELHPMLTRLLGADVVLNTELEPALRTVLSEPTAIEQVILNLVVNARDALSGGGSIVLRTENVSLDVGDHPSLSAGPYVRLSVIDTGAGMDAATAARAFEPFFSTKPAGEGTGLGLAVVYGIVHQAGGDIVIETTPGRGTTFRLLFPGIDAPASPVERALATPLRQLEGSETILVAEDDAGVRALVVAALQRYGYRVMSAVDGMQAFELYRTYGHLVDLLVTDVNMPGLKGTELAQMIAEDDAALPVLYISGFTSRSLQLAELPPRRAFLPKPFNPTQLAQAVRSLLDDG